MNRILFSTLFIISFVFSAYLQEGLYPDCSYVIVTEDGWKIHKNDKGRILSMIPKENHNMDKGKYSFDKFGNLIPYIPCNNEQNYFYLKTDGGFINSDSESETKKTEVEIEFELDLSKLFDINLDFSVYGGASMPFGDNIDNYEIAPTIGLDVNLGKFNISINTSSFEYEQELNGNDNVVYYRKNSLSSNNIFLGYTINYKNLYITPSLGLLNRTNEITGAGQANIETTGSDLGFQTEAGYNFGKISIYGSGNISTLNGTNTLYGSEQTATFYNFGLKYNF